jgi:rod shape-determining protein MreD
MCLRILPLPEGFALLNPDWILLTLIYWSLSFSRAVWDLLCLVVWSFNRRFNGAIIGQYALAYSIIIDLFFIGIGNYDNFLFCSNVCLLWVV